MLDFNILVTARPGAEHAAELLAGLRAHGEFEPTGFHDVLVGRVADKLGLLEALRGAAKEPPDAAWMVGMSRVVPIAFSFASEPPQILARANAAVDRLLPTLADETTVCVRAEIRGAVNGLGNQRLAEEVGDHVFAWGKAHGRRWRADLVQPDYLIVIEAVDGMCGIGLVPRAMRERYPFVHAR